MGGRLPAHLGPSTSSSWLGAGTLSSPPQRTFRSVCCSAQCTSCPLKRVSDEVCLRPVRGASTTPTHEKCHCHPGHRVPGARRLPLGCPVLQRAASQARWGISNCLSWSLKSPSQRAWAAGVMCLQWVPAAWILTPLCRLLRFPQLACLPPPAPQHAIPLHTLPQRWSAPSQASAGTQWHPPGSPPPACQEPLHLHRPARHPTGGTRLSSLTGYQAAVPCSSHSNPSAHLTCFPRGRVPTKSHSCNTCYCRPLCTGQGPLTLTQPSFCIKGLDLIPALHLPPSLGRCVSLNQPARPGSPAPLASRQGPPPSLS